MRHRGDSRCRAPRYATGWRRSCLRILPEFGGISTTTPDDYVSGPVEWIAEIAHSSRALDLHGKRSDYQRYGVHEYLVVCLQEQRLHWFDLRADEELQADADGVCRMFSFAGLWIDSAALFAKNYQRLMSVLEQGLATPEHGAFVRKLQSTSARRKKG